MEKSWNSGKWQNRFPDLEKSWNLKKRSKLWKNHGFSKMHHGKIIEFCFLRFSRLLLLRFFCAHARNWSFSFRIDHGKRSENHGKIMEFHFGKWLETLSHQLSCLLIVSRCMLLRRSSLSSSSCCNNNPRDPHSTHLCNCCNILKLDVCCTTTVCAQLSATAKTRCMLGYKSCKVSYSG